MPALSDEKVKTRRYGSSDMVWNREGSAATGGEGAVGGELAAERFLLLLFFVGLTKKRRNHIRIFRSCLSNHRFVLIPHANPPSPFAPTTR